MSVLPLHTAGQRPCLRKKPGEGWRKRAPVSKKLWHNLLLTEHHHPWMKNIVIPPPSPQAITTGQFSAEFSRAFPYCVALRWKSSALHCQTFIPEQCHSSYYHTAFQLWQQRSMHGLTQCIIQRSSPSQRGRNSLQRFCTNKQQKFLKLFSRFLMWRCVPSLYVQLSKQDLAEMWKMYEK